MRSGSGGVVTFTSSLIHNARLSRDGKWLYVSFQGGSRTGGVDPANDQFLWHVETADIYMTITPLGGAPPPGYNQSTHYSWNSDTRFSDTPIITTFTTGSQTTLPSTIALQDEIGGIVSPANSTTVYRFAHLYTIAHDFNAQGMTNVSHDGEWAIFTSDWGGTSRDDVFLVPLR